MWFSLIFKNLKLFIKNQPVLFIFIIITQIVCVITAFTVAGMIDAVTPTEDADLPYWQKSYTIGFERYEENLENESIPWLNVLYDLNTGELLYAGTDKKKADEITEKLGEDNITGLTTNLPNNYLSVPKVSDVRERIDKVLNAGGKYLHSMYITGYTDELFTVAYTGHYGSNDFLNKYRSELIGESLISIKHNPSTNTVFKNTKNGDTVTINNTDYTISKTEVDTWGAETRFDVLYPYCDDDFSVFAISILLEDNAPQEVRGEVMSLINELFSNDAVNIHEAEPIPLIEKQFNNMVYVVSFILIAVVLLNIARLYTYIMSKRQKNIAVCQLCGADKFKSFLLYITEVIITLIVTYAIGILLFHFLLINPVSYIFPTFAEFFNISIYTNIFIAYLIIGIVIMSFNLIPLVYKTITENKKGGK